MKKVKKYLSNQSGQLLFFILIVMGVVLASTLALIGGAQVFYANSIYNTQAEKASALAEAGIDKALTALNQTGGTYTGEQEIALEDGSFSITITTKDAGTKVIESIGYIPDKSNPKVKRTAKIEASKGTGVAFVYGVQVGEGGLSLGNSNVVEGTVYANGNITAGNSNVITGDAWVAGGHASDPDQISECEGVNCLDYIFGKNIDSEERQSVAQGFKLSETAYLNKVALKLKKFGNPGDSTVRILRDNGSGMPDKNGVLASGTLYSSLVTSEYAWIDVTFSTIPQLTGATTYWLMVSSALNSNNYWSWQNDLAQIYNDGVPKWCSDWQKCKTWNNITGDLDFQAYVGGIPTSIQGNLQVNGNVHANTIQDLTIDGDAYYQSLVNTTVRGTQYPGSADPPPKVFPVSDANINSWKQQAEAGGTTVGNITTCQTTLGPRKIIGSVLISSNCTMTIKSPLWVTGDFSLNSNNIVKLDSSYGSTAGVIVVDGKVILNTNNLLQGTGADSSLLMLLSNFDSRTNNEAAIAINGNGNSGVFYAKDGIIEPGSNNTYKELTAWGIRVINNSVINYESGLSSTLFSSGPGGSFSLVKGTYQVK